MQNVNGVTVTTARIVTPKKTYALANVSSVSLKSRHPHSTAGLLLILLGLIVLVVGASMGSTGGGLLFGGALFVLGIILLCIQEFVVVLRAAGGESDAYESTNRQFAHGITQAIEQAIVARG
jgi:membrane-bound ClpP family serine protease